MPSCREPDCQTCLRPWGTYYRRAVRGEDGVQLQPIPIARFICPAGHGTTSYLPKFLQRYLHYAAEVVEAVVEAVVEGREPEADGPSANTIGRWAGELLAAQVQQRLCSWLPPDRVPLPQLVGPASARRLSWQSARQLGIFLQADLFLTAILQGARLSLMTRYAR